MLLMYLQKTPLWLTWCDTGTSYKPNTGYTRLLLRQREVSPSQVTPGTEVLLPAEGINSAVCNIDDTSISIRGYYINSPGFAQQYIYSSSSLHGSLPLCYLGFIFSISSIRSLFICGSCYVLAPSYTLP